MKNILIDWVDAMRIRDEIERAPYFANCVYGIPQDKWEDINADDKASISDPIFFKVYQGQNLYIYSLFACDLSLFIPSIFIRDEALEGGL